MNDRVFFGFCALLALAMIALALVWPQGLGAPSPEPFGGPPAQPSPAQPSQVPIN